MLSSHQHVCIVILLSDAASAHSFRTRLLSASVVSISTAPVADLSLRSSSNHCARFGGRSSRSSDDGMGNESSKGDKRSAGGSGGAGTDDDGPVRIGGGGGGGGGVTRGSLDARSNSVTLDGHTPYHAPPEPAAAASSTAATHAPGQSFDEDRHSDESYAALDDGPVSIGGGGGGSGGGQGSDSDGPVSIGGGRRGSASSSRHSDIVQLNRAMSHDETDVAMMHPEVEALLSMAQVGADNGDGARAGRGAVQAWDIEAVPVGLICVKKAVLTSPRIATSMRYVSICVCVLSFIPPIPCTSSAPQPLLMRSTSRLCSCGPAPSWTSTPRCSSGGQGRVRMRSAARF